MELVTGHGRDLNWKALARGCTALVVYVGMARLHTITHQLMRAGMAACTPATAIQDATRADQREIVSTLARLARDVDNAGIGSPAIVVIGEVVRLAEPAACTLRQATG